MMNLTSRHGRTVAALAAALILMGGVAEARVGGGRGGFGSRGMRTYTAPPVTRTAPGVGTPIQRSQTPQMQNRPTAPGAQMAQPRRFGFGTGLMAGLLGAGLFGMLFGNGFFGGLGGLGSFFGLILQIGLLVLLGSMALRWFRRRQEPAAAGTYGRSPLQGGSVPPAGARHGIGGLGGGLGSGLGAGLGGASGTAPGRSDGKRPFGTRDEIGIGDADYAAFERALIDVQDAYNRQDVAALWTLATPEMAGYIQEELNENAGTGKVNAVSDVRLLQGDLAEAWREDVTDYATVAMRFSMIDVTRDKATGRVIEGDPAQPVEVTEMWTFRRDRGGRWVLSAIQTT
jgi:predicted lipid-binding transport protein (Tim44 family)